MADENTFLPFENGPDDEVTGVPEKNEEMSFAVPSRKVNPQILLFIGIVSIGGGMLWGMRYFGSRSGMSFTMGEVDYPLAPPSGVRLENEMRIMKDLELSDQLVQMPAEDINRNPFTAQRTKEVVTEYVPVDDTLDRQEMERLRRMQLEREKLLAQISDQANNMKVSSIMLGTRPVAVVDGKPVTVGNTVGLFKVERIEDRVVVISAEGLQFRLSMGDD